MTIKKFKLNNIAVRVYKPDNVKRVLISVHGFAGDKESTIIIRLAEELTPHDIAVVSFDLPCHLESKTDHLLRLSDCTDALNMIFNFVKTNFKDLPVSFFATSFGATLTLQHLQNSNEEFENIILRAPAVNMGEVLKDRILPFHNLTLDQLKQQPQNLGYEFELFIDYNFYEDVEKLKLDNFKKRFIHVMQGKQDDVVLYRDVVNFFETKCKSSYKLYEFESADHRFKNPGEQEKIICIVKDIFKIK